MIKIEPCACGGDAVWEYTGDDHYPRYFVHCTKCSSRVPNAETAHYMSEHNSYFRRNRAIKEWNDLQIKLRKWNGE